MEHVRPAGTAASDRANSALGVAAGVVRGTDRDDVLATLCRGCRGLFGADWAAVVTASSGDLLAVDGGVDLPSREWLSAFVIGSRSGEGSFAAVDELARAEMPRSEAEILVSRADIPLRRAELDLLAGLADITSERLSQIHR